MADLNTLRPEVADAVSALDETTCMTNPGLKWYATIHAELLRLAECEQAAGQLAIEKAEFRQRNERAEAELATAQNTIAAQQGTMGALKRKLALSEGELAALKARIAKAPTAQLIDQGRAVQQWYVRATDGSLLALPPAISGKRVRLVVEE